MNLTGTAMKTALFATLAFLFQGALAQSHPLAGTTWALTSYAPGGAAHALVAGSEVTLEFGPRGQAVFGSGGCNRYRALLLLSDGSLALGPLISTRMACAEDVTSQEVTYLALLARASTFTLDGDRLTLGSGDGELTFTASGDTP